MVSLQQPNLPKAKLFRSFQKIIRKSIRLLYKFFKNTVSMIRGVFFLSYQKASVASDYVAAKNGMSPSRFIRVMVYYTIFLLLITGIVQPNFLDFDLDSGVPVIASIALAQQVAKDQQDWSLQFESLLTDSVDDQRLIYTIKPGESIWTIAKQFGTSTKELLIANDLVDANVVRPWQKLIISYSKTQLIYEVENPISVTEFSSEYDLELEELMSLNFISDENKILNLWDQLLIDLSIPEAQRKWLYQKPEYETPQELLELEEKSTTDIVLWDDFMEDDAIVSLENEDDVVFDESAVGQKVISAEETTNNFDENELRQLQEIKNKEMEAARREEERLQAARNAAKPDPVVSYSNPAPSNTQQPLPVQQRVIEATAISPQCKSNQCLYKWKCRYLPANAECAWDSFWEAWTCRSWYVEYASQCITKDAYDKKKRAEAARAVTKPAKHWIVSQRYFNPYNDWYGNGRAWWHCTHGAGRRRWKNYGIMTNRRWNGGKWYYNASAAGRQVWQNPEVWAIFSTKWAAENWRYGHVWIVTQIDRKSGSMMVVDMNYVWQYTFSQRRVPIRMPWLIGFIYPRKK